MGLAAGGVAIAAVAVAVWAWQPGGQINRAAATPAREAVLSTPPTQAARAVVAAVTTPTAPTTNAAEVAAPAAPLMTPEQWQVLQTRLADHPQRDAEAARIVSLLGFQRAVTQWRAAQRRDPASPAVAEQARALAAQTLPRLRAGELAGPEALALQAALIAAHEPDPTRRAQALAQWRDTASAAVAQPGDPRDAAYLAAQADVVAAWHRQHPTGQPDAALVAELDALRRRYDTEQPRGASR